MNPGTASSYIELNEAWFKENVAFIRTLLKPDTVLSAVVKGNAYGHGIAHVVPMAERAGIHHFSVYGVEEVLDFQNAAQNGSELMVMGYIDPSNLSWIIAQGYSFFVYDIPQLRAAAASAKKANRKAHIHIEVETGMNRTGMAESDLNEVVDIVRMNSGHLVLEGLCTHLAGAESIANYYRIKQQKERFKRHIRFFRQHEVHFNTLHAVCSAGLIRFPEAQYDLVRVGILLYGFWPSRETLITFLGDTHDVDDPITSVLSWKSKVMTVKEVALGEYIGYGTSFMANRNMRIAIIPVGYAYGYNRNLSNLGRVLIHGQRVGVVGTVNMNMMAIDVTEVEGVKSGDEVVLIGFQGDNRITVASFSDLSAQMNYELLARLPHNLPRIVV